MWMASEIALEYLVDEGQVQEGVVDSFHADLTQGVCEGYARTQPARSDRREAVPALAAPPGLGLVHHIVSNEKGRLKLRRGRINNVAQNRWHDLRCYKGQTNSMHHPRRQAARKSKGMPRFLQIQAAEATTSSPRASLPPGTLNCMAAAMYCAACDGRSAGLRITSLTRSFATSSNVFLNSRSYRARPVFPHAVAICGAIYFTQVSFPPYLCRVR